MGLAKYTSQQEVRKLELEIRVLREENAKGWIARIRRHYRIKKLQQRINQLQQL